MTPEVNVLLAASRSDHPHHAVARAWLEEAISASGDGAAFTLMPMVLASFLRLVTSPKIFQLATPVEDAVAFVDALLAAPGVQRANLGPEWSRLRQLCLDKQLVGNDVPDCMAIGSRGAHGGAPRQLRSRLQKAAAAPPLHVAQAPVALVDATASRRAMSAVGCC